MTLWLVRGGKYGEHESRFFDAERIHATWEGFSRDIGRMTDMQELREALQEVYPDLSKKAAINYSGQLWGFAHEMSPGDWVECRSGTSRQ
jgi:restriction system protein